ncbi:MAG: choline ABC transporter permease subunit [Geminicoccaceae bacterium]|nr:MAG: choline ABC transporter permease subunit [Geminicoccaceae bacterium]
MDWLTANKLPIGRWIRDGVDLLDRYAGGVFDAIAFGLGSLIDAVTRSLLALSPVATILIFAALVFWLHRSWRVPLLLVVSLLLIVNLGYWRETMETLALVSIATFFCMTIGVPVGIAAAHHPPLYTAIRPLLDLMQTIPTFVYLIPTLILFGLGVVPGLISTIVFALPAPIRLTQLGISSVPLQLREAADAFGASRWQKLLKVELPHALPAILAGLTQCIMLSLSMVVIAALVGADGLGKPVVRALNTINVAMGFEAGLSIVILAILLDRIVRVPRFARPGIGR